MIRRRLPRELDRGHRRGGQRPGAYPAPPGGVVGSCLQHDERAADGAVRTGAVFAPAAAAEGITQGWEHSFVHPADTPFRFALDRAHVRIEKLWYDHRLLVPVEVRELDWTYTNWYALGNYPHAWTTGTGGMRQYELYEAQTTDTRAYSVVRDRFLSGGVGDGMLRYLGGVRTYVASPAPPATVTIGFAWTCQGDSQAFRAPGLPWIRLVLYGQGLRLTGDPVTTSEQAVHAWERAQLMGTTPTTETAPVGCYPWECQYGATVIPVATGAIREVQSPDRQYFPVVAWPDQVPLGKIDDVHSSAGNLLCLETIEPDAPALLEQDVPGMVPGPLQKYLRYYVLYRAFNRQGEGYMPQLASVWQARYQMGALVLQQFGWLQRADHTQARQPVSVRGRPPRPRLPSHYPSLGV